MVYRIIAYFFFSAMIIALVLSFAGVTEVYLGNGFTNWLRLINTTFEKWSFEIPKIPDIPLLEDEAIFSESKAILHTRVATTPVVRPNSVLGGIRSIINVIIVFFNFLIKIINVAIVLINIVIKIIQFTLTMVWCVKDLPRFLTNDEWVRWNGDSTIWWWKSIGSH